MPAYTIPFRYAEQDLQGMLQFPQSPYMLCFSVDLCMRRPLYLITNMSGREYPRWANHFDPYSPIYSRRERSEILVSDCALGLAFSGLYSLAQTFGWLWLAKVLHHCCLS